MAMNIAGATKPIESEEKVDINDRFYAHYTHYVNGASFFRPNNAWYKFTKRNYVDSTTNPAISIPRVEGVLFECFEHVSVCIGGSSDFIMTRHDYGYDANGTLVSDAISDKAYTPWTLGYNNVDHGVGHLPTEKFTRVFNEDYKTCCILPVENADVSQVYNFEVVQLDNSSHTLNKNIKFMHVAYGSVAVDGNVYSQKQNLFGMAGGTVPSGTVLSSTERSIAILGYIVE